MVSDIEAACTELMARGVDVAEIQDMGGVLFGYFADPDGNSWLLQQFPSDVTA